MVSSSNQKLKPRKTVGCKDTVIPVVEILLLFKKIKANYQDKENLKSWYGNFYGHTWHHKTDHLRKLSTTTEKIYMLKFNSLRGKLTHMSAYESLSPIGMIPNQF